MEKQIDCDKRIRERDSQIDIVKGVAICLVVLGHCGCPVTHFLYLFHVAVFFCVSGMMYKSSYSENFYNLRLLLIRRIKSLWKPFFLYTTFFLLTWNIFVELNLYDACKKNAFEISKEIVANIFFLGHSGPLCGAFWFLGNLFFITLIYAFFDFIFIRFACKYRWICHIGMALIILFGGTLLVKYSIQSSFLRTITSTYIAYVMGTVFACLKKYNRDVFYLPMLLLGFFSLLICDKIGSIEISKGVLTNPIFYIVASISGWFFIFALAFFLDKILLLKQFFCFLGKNTMCVIGLHFLGFKLVTLFQIYVYDYPIQKLATFPVLVTISGWWFVYFVVSMLFCLSMNCIYGKTILSLKNRIPFLSGK